MNTKKAAVTVLSITWKIVLFALVVLAIYRLGGAAYAYGHAVFEEEAYDPAPGRTVTVTIEQGASNKQIAHLLEDQGLVKDWRLFYVQILCSRYAKTMQAGTYTLNSSMTPRELMAVMSGEKVETEEEE